jgi:hypothetical protein
MIVCGVPNGSAEDFREAKGDLNMVRTVSLDDDVISSLEKVARPLEGVNEVLRRILPLAGDQEAFRPSDLGDRAASSSNHRLSQAPRHRYTREDDIVALYLYKCGDRGLPQDTDTIARNLGIKPGSLRMRIENFRAIATDGAEGLENWAKQSKVVYDEYSHHSCDDLREIVLPYVQG